MSFVTDLKATRPENRMEWPTNKDQTKILVGGLKHPEEPLAVALGAESAAILFVSAMVLLDDPKRCNCGTGGNLQAVWALMPTVDL